MNREVTMNLEEGEPKDEAPDFLSKGQAGLYLEVSGC